MTSSKLMVMIFLFATLSCDKESPGKKFLLESIDSHSYYSEEIIPSGYKGLYGTWKLVNVSGGFSGSGHENNFDYLVIEEIGIYGIVRENTLIEYGKIERETFDPKTDEYLQVKFVSDPRSGFKSLSAPESYLNLKADDSLEIISACCDRYNFHFTKEE
jgi:hypothetical protein